MMAQADEAGKIQEPWLTTDEAREMLGATHRAFQRLLTRGVLVRQRNPFDARVYQIARADVERVVRDGVDGMRPPRRKTGQGETA